MSLFKLAGFIQAFQSPHTLISQLGLNGNTEEAVQDLLRPSGRLSSAAPPEDERKFSTVAESHNLGVALFDQVKGFGQSYLFLEDFQKFIPNPRLSKMAFEFFDSDGDEHITAQEFTSVVRNIAYERKALAIALLDARGSVERFDGAVTGLLIIILVSFHETYEFIFYSL